MTDRELMQMALPCPFCGSNKVSVEEGSTFRWVYATCNDCGAQAGEVRKQTVGEGNPQQWHEKAQRMAMEEWNTRARLAQPEPEPVAWMHDSHVGFNVPLYTAPPQREWQGLTDEEIENCFEMSMFGTCRAIEAKLKEKNNA